MLRALWFAVKIGLFVAVAVWVANRPGVVELNWLGYAVRAHVGLVLLALLFLLAAALFLHRLLWNIISLPKFLRRRAERKRQDKGYKALILGLSAVAAGDVKLAAYQTQRTRKFLPKDKGLPVLLAAQSARLRGDDNEAQELFEQLLKNKDAAFLGLRGLLTASVEKGNTAESLEFARKALAMHPKQPWILRMVYRLQLREGQWDMAEKTLRKAVRYEAFTKEQARSDKLAVFLQQGDECLLAGLKSQALKKFKQAHRLNPAFVPTALRLAGLHQKEGRRRSAVSVIEGVWKESPHPELAPLWGSLAPQNKADDSAVRLRWFERLMAFKPENAESQMAVAQEALNEGLWGEAQRYLTLVDEESANARFYRLQARLAEGLQQPEEARRWLEKAADAPPDRVWTCQETGRIYDHWSSVAVPHGAFNSIVWDFPQPYAMERALPDRTELLITASAATK